MSERPRDAAAPEPWRGVVKRIQYGLIGAPELDRARVEWDANQLLAEHGPWSRETSRRRANVGTAGAGRGFVQAVSEAAAAVKFGLDAVKKKRLAVNPAR